MICNNCRHQIDDNSRFCPDCGAPIETQTQNVPQQNTVYNQPQNGQNVYGQPAYFAPPPPPPVNQTPYLIWSILVTLLCFFPLGIPAIVYAAKISSALSAGNYQLAVDSAKKSKLFSILGACIGAAVIIIAYVALFFIGVGIGMSEYGSGSYYSYY